MNKRMVLRRRIFGGNMLKKITEGRVESDEGFSIHIIGLEVLRYEENGKSIILDWTLDPKSKKMRIYVSDALSWDKPTKEKLTVDDKNKIIKNIKRAVVLLEGDYEVI
ncbi:MAG: hypothetical protein KDC47_07540 [Flavobacteriaceae bacterium]|nr:hypothetical protein [Flavobacteriaceae bacterium]